MLQERGSRQNWYAIKDGYPIPWTTPSDRLGIVLTREDRCEKWCSRERTSSTHVIPFRCEIYNASHLSCCRRHLVFSARRTQDCQDKMTGREKSVKKKLVMRIVNVSRGEIRSNGIHRLGPRSFCVRKNRKSADMTFSFANGTFGSVTSCARCRLPSPSISFSPRDWEVNWIARILSQRWIQASEQVETARRLTKGLANIQEPILSNCPFHAISGTNYVNSTAKYTGVSVSKFLFGRDFAVCKIGNHLNGTILMPWAR